MSVTDFQEWKERCGAAGDVSPDRAIIKAAREVVRTSRACERYTGQKVQHRSYHSPALSNYVSALLKLCEAVEVNRG